MAEKRLEARGWRLEAGRKGLGRFTGAFSLQPSAFSKGFTLVELLVVIAILGILISLVTAGAQAARRRGAMTKAKTTIAALETAIAMYEADMGEYPETGNEGLVAEWGGGGRVG